MISCRYNEAFDDLNNALRSAPIKTAEGFKSKVSIFLISYIFRLQNLLF